MDPTAHPADPPPPAPGFGRRFLPVWCVGLIGVAGLLWQPLPDALLAQAPQLRELPGGVLRLLLLVNPLILVTVMAAVGAALAHRVGLRSGLAGDTRARLDPGTALAVGTAVAVVLLLADAALADRLGPGWQRALAEAAAAPWLPTLLVGVLYGGLAEEILLRWGLMALVAWALVRWGRGRAGGPAELSAPAAWIAIGVAAAAFAAAHLPALAQSVALSGPVVLRTLALNLLAGLAYGWLFWRRSLESAMLAHATTHVGLAAGRVVLG